MARQLRDFRKSHKAQLIRAQQTSQATIDSFPDPVLVIDQNQQVELANPVARRLLGILPPTGGQRQPSPGSRRSALRQPLADGPARTTPYLPEGFDKAIVLQIGDKSHSFLPRILPIRDADGATLGAAVLLEDITRFRLLDEVKTNLVATVSHELKTPLTSIRLVLHLLLEEQIGPLAPKQLELLVDARDNAERLLVMINNLLDLARLEQGRTQLRLRPERPMATCCRRRPTLFRPRAADRGRGVRRATIRPACPRWPPTPSNFNMPCRTCWTTPWRTRRRADKSPWPPSGRDGKVVFSVTDTGSGIPAEYLPLIFEKYFRVPGDTTQGGSGLGLAIVREIVTAHGGTVRCESRPARRPCSA